LSAASTQFVRSHTFYAARRGDTWSTEGSIRIENKTVMAQGFGYGGNCPFWHSECDRYLEIHFSLTGDEETKDAETKGLFTD
jgi:hypothetical protein